MTQQDDDTTSLGVMVLDDHPERAAMVERSLVESGFRVVSLLASSSGLLHQIEAHRPDVIVIDLESPDRDVLESLAIVSAHNPTPIVMFSENDDPEFVRQAVGAGVTAYQGDGLNPAMVKPIIEVAMAQFRSFDILRRELLQTRGELEEHKLIEAAKRRLSEHRGIDAEEAYALMRRLSMNTNKRLVEIAETIVATMSMDQTDE